MLCHIGTILYELSLFSVLLTASVVIEVYASACKNVTSNSTSRPHVRASCCTSVQIVQSLFMELCSGLFRFIAVSLVQA